MPPAAAHMPGEVGASHNDADADDEDYMTMAIPEPDSSIKVESSHQRRERQRREAEDRSRPKSKAELAAEAERARESALATSIADQSKGAKMMARLGYKPGSTLGAPGNVHARAEPIGLEVKEGKEGIGVLSERKRKFREKVERTAATEKRLKEDQGDYRERVVKEREEKRTEGQWWGAMKVLEGLEEDFGVQNNTTSKVKKNRNGTKRTADVTLLYRPLVYDRREMEKESRRRHDLLQSLSRNARYDDPEEDAHDRQALGKEVESDGDEAEEDEELQGYLQLSAGERLAKLLGELRENWQYCFWCKYRYGSKEEMDSECPGETEDDHG